jgi:hypothetical protein
LLSQNWRFPDQRHRNGLNAVARLGLPIIDAHASTLA